MQTAQTITKAAGTTTQRLPQHTAALAYARHQQQLELARDVAAARQRRERDDLAANVATLAGLALCAVVLRFGPAVLSAIEAWWAR